MKSKVIATFILAFLTVAFQNCERSPLIAYEGKIDSLVKNQSLQSNRIDKKIASLTYFKGGWYGPVDVPNWTYDLTIKLKNDVLNVSAKTTDELCGKVSQDLTDSEITELKKLLSDLDVKSIPSDAPIMMDAGTRQITVQYLNEEPITILLSTFFGQHDGYYATNGDSLAAFLENLDQSLAMYCQ